MNVIRRDRFALAGCTLAGLLVILPLGWLVFGLLQAGLPGLDPAFLVSAPINAGRGGGIGPMIIATLLILAVCLAVVIPIGLGTAVYLSEYVPADSRAAGLLGYSLDVLATVPSIVFALFGYQFFAITLGLGFSILSGGLTLACMSLPLMARTAEQALRSIPITLRQSGEALALTRIGMLRHVLLPAALPGITAGIILSIGRALAETAVLLFTAGYVLRMPGSLLDSGRALSVHVYDMAMNVPGGMPAAASTALVLLSLVVISNFMVRQLLLKQDRTVT